MKLLLMKHLLLLMKHLHIQLLHTIRAHHTAAHHMILDRPMIQAAVETAVDLAVAETDF